MVPESHVRLPWCPLLGWPAWRLQNTELCFGLRADGCKVCLGAVSTVRVSQYRGSNPSRTLLGFLVGQANPIGPEALCAAA